jgi:hypothetical protein
MILTNKNLEKWKALLDKKMKKRYEVESYSDAKKDSEWLEEYTDYTEEDAIADEIQYWDE